MCGIAGIIHTDFEAVNFDDLKEMTDIQRHRGPDDQGFAGFSFQKKIIKPIDPVKEKTNYSFHGGLGFNRLSILDLSLNGHQPMISINEKVVIAYNGETYNAYEFKNQLEKKGYRFKSTTDTEIILYLYQEYGMEKLLDLVNGMFGLAIVDIEKEKVFLARDHAGIKPMYWYKNGDTILFASEIKSFLKYPRFRAEIEKENISEYIYYKYTAFDRTLFKKVNQVPAGHFLEISKNTTVLKEYWNPAYNPRETSKKEALDLLDKTLKSGIKNQLMSDVKVGSQLSGGIDSSLITTFARSYFDANMDSFSIILENKKYSEEKYIDQVIKRVRPLAHKFELNPHYFTANYAKATWHLDVPLPIPQTVGFKRLAEGATNFVKVLLSGEGSDELMGGYVQQYYQAFKQKNQWAIKVLSHYPVKGKKIARQYLPKVAPEDYFYRFRSAIPLAKFLGFLPNSDLEKIYHQRIQLYPREGDLLFKTRSYDMKSWLVNILNLQDKMTMAHSIENRVPFLDKNLINLVFSLPSSYFIKSQVNPLKYNSPNYHTKILLKKLASEYYNQDFVYRKKMGFDQPLNDYFSDKKMQEIIHDSFLPGIKSRGIFDSKKVEFTWQQFSKHQIQDDLNLLWLVFSFELWAQIFIDGESLKN